MNDLNALLKTIITTAKEINIPVSDNISEKIAVNYRAVGRFGLCRKTAGGHYEIEITHRLLDANEKACMTVLAHEALHTCPNCMNHGKLWKCYAMLLNNALALSISNSDSYEKLGLENIAAPKYVVICNKCGATIYRRRMSQLVKRPERYRCRCGGSFTVNANN